MEFMPSHVDISQPPPQLSAPSALATNVIMLQQPSGGTGQHSTYFRGHSYHNHHYSGSGKVGHNYFKPFTPGGFQRPFGMTQDDFDGKRLRKSVMRKTVDYNASIVKGLEARLWQRDYRDRPALEPESIYIPDLLPPTSYLDNPSNSVTTRFVKTATNKMRCPIFTLAWTPEGRRLVTGASSGEFTLWNGMTFNFETILQAHDVAVRTMVWSHNDSWMVTGDHAGYVKYWQSNMNNIKTFQAHKQPIRGISFSPTDSKFVSCSDDGTLKIFDFLRCTEERILRGHGADVKCVDWHPQKGLIVSGSKNNQQPIKLWDPKSGSALATLHAHKSTVMDLQWNANGNWLVTASCDHLLKLFDLRNLREEAQVFRGHKKEASSVAWHPIHEGLFSSGGSDGSILFWNVGTDKEIGCVETAHNSIVWTLAWHPLGHILCSGSNDHTIKFWTRNRPGDLMRDKYNLNTLPASLAALDECEYDDAIIPGMGPEDKIEFTESLTADKGFIPGLDLDPSKTAADKDKEKKVPYSKPIPRNFQAQWAATKRTDENPSVYDELAARETKDTAGLTPQQISENIIEGMLASGALTSMDPQAVVGILVYGRFIRVHPDSRLMLAIQQGPDYLNKYIDAGKLNELRDVIPSDERSRSLSPTLEIREKSPPIKKSRFETHEHNPQPVFVREVLSLKKPFLPCLINLKSQKQTQPQTTTVAHQPTEQQQTQIKLENYNEDSHDSMKQQQMSVNNNNNINNNNNNYNNNSNNRSGPWLGDNNNGGSGNFQQQQQQKGPWDNYNGPNQNGYNGPYNNHNNSSGGSNNYIDDIDDRERDRDRSRDRDRDDINQKGGYTNNNNNNNRRNNNRRIGNSNAGGNNNNNRYRPRNNRRF